MKTFSAPLSTAEEAYYLQALQGDDESLKKLARDTLIIRNLRLVAHIAKKYQNVDEDMEDLISIGTIGLIKAIESFDCSKGKLSTYASRCIDNELLMLLRFKKKTAKDISLYDPIGTDKEGNEISLLDVTCSEQSDVLEKVEDSEHLQKLPSLIQEKLNERERYVIMLRYGLLDGVELTQRTIAKRMGISRSYVSRIEKRALEKLREGYE